MAIENGPKAFVIPLHCGAYKFWSQQRVKIPEHAIPVDYSKVKKYFYIFLRFAAFVVAQFIAPLIFMVCLKST